MADTLVNPELSRVTLDRAANRIEVGSTRASAAPPNRRASAPHWLAPRPGDAGDYSRGTPTVQYMLNAIDHAEHIRADLMQAQVPDSQAGALEGKTLCAAYSHDLGTENQPR